MRARILAAGVFAAVATTSVAASVTELENLELGAIYKMRGANPNNINDLNAGGLTDSGKVQLNGVSTGDKAGAFNLRGVADVNANVRDFGAFNDSFIAFCLQYDVSSFAGQVGTVVDTKKYFGAKYAAIGALWSNAFHLTKNNRFATAAFQLSLWEIVHETSGDWSLTSGDFVQKQATFLDWFPDRFDSKTMDFARVWLGKIARGDWVDTGVKFSVLKGAGQDIITPGGPKDPTPPASPVPLPAGFGLLLGGLGMLGLGARFKRG